MRSALRSHACASGAGFLTFSLLSATANIRGMRWIAVIIQKLFDWILEIPKTFLSRKLELFLDREAIRKRKKSQFRRRKMPSNPQGGRRRRARN
jgi:hypothetical protein